MKLTQIFSGKGISINPSKAAEIVARYTPYRWTEVDFPPPSASSLMQETANQRACRRFENPDSLVQKQIGAHCLFRAAAHLPGSEQDAADKLILLGMLLVGEVVNGWLEDR